MTRFGPEDAKRLALQLSGGRVFRNGAGWKTFCPLCQSETRRRKPRPTLSITGRSGKILVHCHRCKSGGLTIVHKLVSLGLLPNQFRRTSAALTVVDTVRAAMGAAVWIGTPKATDRRVLIAVTQIAERCRREDFGASIREVALLALLNKTTVWRSLDRLSNAGWLEKISGAQDQRSAIWRLRVPKEVADRGATIQRAGSRRVRLLQVDPSSQRGGRADLSRSVIPSSHDAFRWGKGLGAIKGQIYELLKMPLTAAEIAELLGYKTPRSARVHLQKLIGHGLARRGADGRYERGDAALDTVADRLGVLGETAAQRERYRRETATWQTWWRAYEQWKETGEVIDPETGVVLESRNMPRERATMANFRLRVLAGRVINADAFHRVDQLQPLPNALNLEAETAFASPQEASREPISSSGGALDPALEAAVAKVQQRFPDARLVEVRNPLSSCVHDR
jgi:hypothetical protein